MKRKSTFIIIFITLSVIIFVGRAYFFSYTSSDVVTLLPDDSKIKKKPKDPGGLVIPNSDSLVYESLRKNVSKGRKINILPDPEEPIEISRTQEPNTKNLDSIDAILDNIDYYENEYMSQEEVEGKENSDYVVPNILLAKTDDNQDDKSIYIPGTSLNIIKALDGGYKITDYQLINNEDVGYKIQLSSSYSQNDAKSQWQAIRQKHRKILSDANLIIKKVEGKNERIFFLVMAGNYPSLSHAKLVCKQLSRRKQNCIVTK